MQTIEQIEAKCTSHWQTCTPLRRIVYNTPLGYLEISPEAGYPYPLWLDVLPFEEIDSEIERAPFRQVLQGSL